MSIFTSKHRIKQQYLQIFQLLSDGKYCEDFKYYQFIENKLLHRNAVDVIISLIINFSISINKKINALLLAKGLFQTGIQQYIQAHPAILQESTRLMTYLVDIVKFSISNKQPAANYFFKKQRRIQFQIQQSQKYVRLASQIIKQWNQYMIDCKEYESPYITVYNQLERKGIKFNELFIYFKMRDYVEFMKNWMRRKTRNVELKDKVDFYLLLSNDINYGKNIDKYKNSLSQYSQLIIQQIYSLLINHLVPVDIKIRCLKCLRELYQEANLLFLQKVDQILVPFFSYLINLFVNNQLPIDRYFQHIQKRITLDHSYSKIYITQILLMIKQWDKYAEKRASNKFESLRIQIDKKNLLQLNQINLFNPNDIKQFNDNVEMGKHRQGEYISQKKVNGSQIFKKSLNTGGGYNTGGFIKKPSQNISYSKKMQNDSFQRKPENLQTNQQINKLQQKKTISNVIYNNAVQIETGVGNIKNSKVQFSQNSDLELVDDYSEKSNKNSHAYKSPNQFQSNMSKKQSLLNIKQKQIQEQLQQKKSKFLVPNDKYVHSQEYKHISSSHKLLKANSPTDFRRQYSGYKLSDVVKYHESRNGHNHKK